MPSVLPSFTSYETLTEQVLVTLTSFMVPFNTCHYWWGSRSGPMPYGFFCNLIVELLLRNLPTDWHVPLLSTSRDTTCLQ